MPDSRIDVEFICILATSVGSLFNSAKTKTCSLSSSCADASVLCTICSVLHCKMVKIQKLLTEL